MGFYGNNWNIMNESTKVKGTKVDFDKNVNKEKMKDDIIILNKNFDKVVSSVANDWYNYCKQFGFESYLEKKKYAKADDIKKDLFLRSIRYVSFNTVTGFEISLDLKHSPDEHVPFTEVYIKNKSISIRQTSFEG